MLKIAKNIASIVAMFVTQLSNEVLHHHDYSIDYYA